MIKVVLINGQFSLFPISDLSAIYSIYKKSVQDNFAQIKTKPNPKKEISNGFRNHHHFITFSTCHHYDRFRAGAYPKRFCPRNPATQGGFHCPVLSIGGFSQHCLYHLQSLGASASACCGLNATSSLTRRKHSQLI